MLRAIEERALKIAESDLRHTLRCQNGATASMPWRERRERPARLRLLRDLFLDRPDLHRRPFRIEVLVTCRMTAETPEWLTRKQAELAEARVTPPVDAQLDSVAIRRLIEEIRIGKETGISAYNRVYTRHNRS